MNKRVKESIGRDSNSMCKGPEVGSYEEASGTEKR